MAWLGLARLGGAWQGVAGQGTAWQGVAGQGVAGQGTARHGAAWRGRARQGLAWQGTAGQGNLKTREGENVSEERKWYTTAEIVSKELEKTGLSNSQPDFSFRKKRWLSSEAAVQLADLLEKEFHCEESSCQLCTNVDTVIRVLQGAGK